MRIDVFHITDQVLNRNRGSKLFFMTSIVFLVFNVILLKEISFGCKTSTLLFLTSFVEKALRNEIYLCVCCKILVQIDVFHITDQFLNRNRGCKLFFMTNIVFLVNFQRDFAKTN